MNDRGYITESQIDNLLCQFLMLT